MNSIPSETRIPSALLSGLEDPLNILPSPYLEGFSYLKFPPFPVAGIHTGHIHNCLVQVPSFRRCMTSWHQSLTLMMCPRTNGALSAFISANAPAVTWSPAEIIAMHLEVVLCDSSASSTNHRFKTLQYLMCGRTSDSVETPAYLLSCLYTFQLQAERNPEQSHSGEWENGRNNRSF